MFLIRSRNKQRQAVAPSHSTAAPSACASTSTSLSLRLSTSHSASSSHFNRPSLPTALQLETVTDGWVCDPAVSALHFSYAHTQEEEEDAEADTDRCQLQSPRPLQSPAHSPVSFFKLDSTDAHPVSGTTTAATDPITYRRVATNQVETAARRSVELKSSPSSATDGPTSRASAVCGGSAGGSGRTREWLQSSIGRLAFRRRTTVEDRACAPAQPVQGMECKRAQSAVPWVPKLTLPPRR